MRPVFLIFTCFSGSKVYLFRMPCCVVCRMPKNSTSINRNISFHKLPEREIRTQWIKFATNHGVSLYRLNRSKVFFCSAHFNTSCFMQRTRLKYNAVPSIWIQRKKKIINGCEYYVKEFIDEDKTKNLPNGDTSSIITIIISKVNGEIVNPINYSSSQLMPDKNKSNEEMIKQTSQIAKLQNQPTDLIDTNIVNYNTSDFSSDHIALKQQEPVAANYLINSADNSFSEDSVNFKYQFGWDVIGECNLPFIFRTINGKRFKYVPRRMVHTLLNYYLSFLPPDIVNYISIKCDFISTYEAKLLNYINKKYHMYFIGSNLFKAHIDCVVHVDDVKELYTFIVACYNKIEVRNSHSSNRKYGYNDKNSYLVSTLNFIKSCFPPNMDFQKCWPRLALDKRLYTNVKECIPSSPALSLSKNVPETSSTYQNKCTADQMDSAILQQSSKIKNNGKFVLPPPIVRVDGTLYWPELNGTLYWPELHDKKD